MPAYTLVKSEPFSKEKDWIIPVSLLGGVSDKRVLSKGQPLRRMVEKRMGFLQRLPLQTFWGEKDFKIKDYSQLG